MISMTSSRIGGFSVYALIQAVVGADIYNFQSQLGYSILGNGIDEFGKPEQQKKPLSYYEAIYRTANTNSAFVEDGTYLRLREVSVRYTFNRRLLQPVFRGAVDRITLALIGRNLFTWTNYSGFDPDMSVFSEATIYRETSPSQYPILRTLTASIEIGF